MGDKVKGSISVEKLAIEARTHAKTSISFDVFRSLVVPHCKTVLPANFCENDPVIVACGGAGLLYIGYRDKPLPQEALGTHDTRKVCDTHETCDTHDTHDITLNIAHLVYIAQRAHAHKHAQMYRHIVALAWIPGAPNTNRHHGQT